MDRVALARAGRRAQAEEALAFERDREEMLVVQLADVALLEEGAAVDAAAFAVLEPADAARVRAVLGGTALPVDDDDELFADGDEETVDVDELERLAGELDECRARQTALERFIAALSSQA